jgi:hypothetical protein
MSEYIKTGNDIEQEIYRASEIRLGGTDLLLKKQWISLDEFNEALYHLEDVLAQGCLMDKDDKLNVLDPPVFDSMALHAYADGIRFLAKHNKHVVIKSDVGRRVIAVLKNGDML